MYRATLTLTVATFLFGLAGAGAASERTDAYRTFREHFDARRYSEALPAAQQVVELSEKEYGPEQMELVIPLTNLGATQLRLKDYLEAEDSFRRALKIVEAREGGFSVDVIRPLLGLGATYAAAGQHIDAVDSLRRALDVSRKINGLFNPEQIVILEPLIVSYVALEQERDAEREREYAIRVAEVAYGKDDVRLLPALARAAQGYEEAERYFSARRLHERALNIITKANGEKKSKDVKDLRMIAHLRGIARGHRLEYLYGGKLWRDDERAEDPVVKIHSSIGGSSLTDEGRKVLEQALEILKTVPEATSGQRGEVLLDLGDWHLVTGHDHKAFRYYKDAWQELGSATGPDTAVLEAPVQIVYKRPTGAPLKPPVNLAAYERSFVEVAFAVTAEGRVTDARIVESDATDRHKENVLSAIKSARYRPRFVAGEPVSTPEVRYRQELFFKKKDLT